MPTITTCPNCQTRLGDNASKCDHCRAFQAGVEAARSSRSRPGLNPLVLVVLVLGLCAIWAASPTGPFGIRAGAVASPSPAPRPPTETPPRSIAPSTGVRFDLTDDGDRASLRVQGRWNVEADGGTVRGHVDVNLGDEGGQGTVRAEKKDRADGEASSDSSWSGRFSWNGIEFHLGSSGRMGDAATRLDRLSVSVGVGTSGTVGR